MSSMMNVKVDKKGKIKTSNDEFIDMYAKSLNEMRVRLYLKTAIAFLKEGKAK